MAFWSSAENDCSLPGCSSAAITVGTGLTSVTIDYTYDALYRLTTADYSTGDSYHYVYDPVGNRLVQERMVGGVARTDAYVYDTANRLVSVDGVAYTWDANGNLLSDGVHTYGYDGANRLTAVTGPQSMASYAYNGAGDRLQQVVDGLLINYTLDLNAGLTQVLGDGAYDYVYGNGRISQVAAGTQAPEYFLGDVLGSVRQLTAAAGAVTYAAAYAPYGEVAQAYGTGSSYGFTGEMQDSYIKLIYLRSRMYSPVTGQFLSRDSYQGDYNRPISLRQICYLQTLWMTTRGVRWTVTFAEAIAALTDERFRDAGNMANTLDEKCVISVFCNRSNWMCSNR